MPGTVRTRRERGPEVHGGRFHPEAGPSSCVRVIAGSLGGPLDAAVPAHRGPSSSPPPDDSWSFRERDPPGKSQKCGPAPGRSLAPSCRCCQESRANVRRPKAAPAETLQFDHDDPHRIIPVPPMVQASSLAACRTGRSGAATGSGERGAFIDGGVVEGFRRASGFPAGAASGIAAGSLQDPPGCHEKGEDSDRFCSRESAASAGASPGRSGRGSWSHRDA